MGNISYTAHVSNKKSAITSKAKLAGVAKHNLRKYKSSDYSKDNIFIVYGTSNLIDDVKTVYHKEFDEALEEYNKKQTRPDRRIEDYFEHVAGKEQDMAVEIIIQIGDREFWKQYDDMKSYIKLSYEIILCEFIKRLPGFVVANAVVHLDEDSPHRTYYKDLTGERKQKTKREFAKKSEALEWERNFKLKENQSISMSFQSFVDIYLTDLEPRIKRNSFLTKKHIIETKILPYFGKRKLTDKQKEIEVAQKEADKWMMITDTAKWQTEQAQIKLEEAEELKKELLRTVDGDDYLKEQVIELRYQNQMLQEENRSLKDKLEKAYEFMKQFVLGGINLLEKFLEWIGEKVKDVKKEKR